MATSSPCWAHELPTPQQAEPIARKLLDAVGAPGLLQGQGEFRITASVGIAAYPMHATDERTLMKQATLALRAAKKLGMNQLQFHGAPVKAKGEHNTA
ncbi:MAG TPA: diguanylate cyclase [Burkholderiaceae bacterium]|nr:diguanylate cyclase [Burkholderiaceae bacterium]